MICIDVLWILFYQTSYKILIRKSIYTFSLRYRNEMLIHLFITAVASTISYLQIMLACIGRQLLKIPLSTRFFYT